MTSVVDGIEEGADVDIEHKVHTLKPAGFEASEGILSAGYLKDASDPQWKD
jgi:hypothetical protein